MRTLFAFVVILLCIPVVAQTHELEDLESKPVTPYLELLLESPRNQGYQSPGYVVRPGIEFWTKGINFNFESTVSTIDKTFERSGTAYKVNTNAYFNLARHFLIGGGYTWGILTTSTWNKQSGHPYISGGVLCRTHPCTGIRVTYDYLFQGTDTSNGVRGGRVHLKIPMYKQRVFAVGGVASYSVYETDCPSCTRVGIAHGEIGIRFER